MRSIRLKLTILFILASILPIAVLSFFALNKSTEVVSNSTQEFLETAVRIKQSVLENYIESTISIGASLSRMDLVQLYVDAKSDVQNSESTNKPDVSFLEKQFDNILFGIQEANWGKYHHIFLIDATNTIVISPNHGEKVKGSPSAHVGEDTSRNKFAVEAMRRGKVVISDYSSWVESNHTHQMVFYPIQNSEGNTRAVIGFELQIPYEEEILSENFEMGETGKMFLATLQGQPITYEGVDERDKIDPQRLAELQQDGYSTGRKVNAEGVEIIGHYIKNEKYPWIIAAEVEASEAFGSVNQLKKLILYAIAATLAIAVLIAILIANSIVAPIKKITDQMTKASMGDLNQEIEGIDRKDEIGDLLNAFNRVLTSLKLAMSHYKKLKEKGGTS